MKLKLYLLILVFSFIGILDAQVIKGGNCWIDYEIIGDSNDAPTVLNLLDSFFSKPENRIEGVTYNLTQFNYKDKDFEATHLLFIDADIGFNHKNIERLLMKDKEIVCGVYPIKDFFWQLAKDALSKNPDITPLELERNSLRYAVNFEDPQNINVENGYALVKDAATGMMLVKREVFDKLILAYPERKYEYKAHHAKKDLKHTYDFFSVGVFEDDHECTYLSEDYYFSRLWQKIGGEIWADLLSSLTHTGNYTFKGNFFSRFEKHK